MDSPFTSRVRWAASVPCRVADVQQSGVAVRVHSKRDRTAFRGKLVHKALTIIAFVICVYGYIGLLRMFRFIGSLIDPSISISEASPAAVLI